MVRQEISIPPDTEKVILNKMEKLKKKTESEKKQQIHLHQMIFSQLKQNEALPYKIQRKRVSDKTESKLDLADVSTEDKAQSQETKRHSPLQRKDKAEKTSVK